MRSYKALGGLLFFVATSALAAPLGPVDCSARVAEIAAVRGEGVEAREWAEHRRQVLQAAPGSAVYAPKPYPVTEADILENFRYGYFDKLFDSGPEGLDLREQRVYRGLQAGTIEVEIMRVENWRVSRCGTHRPMPFFYVLRLFDGEEELSRFVLHHTGLMSRYGQVTEVATEALPELAAVPGELERRFGLELPVEAAQYVTADGLPLDCSPSVPCIAFRSSGDTYLLDRNALLYRIDLAERLSVTEHAARVRAEGPAPVDLDRPFVSQGFEWRRAVLVARDEASVARQTGRPGG